jgi:tRNA/tmRNA/rRNA uracil-C5-methylase (TrmA/RlmC/RlmD family)
MSNFDENSKYTTVKDTFDGSIEKYEEDLKHKVESIARELLPLHMFGPDAVDKESIVKYMDIYPSPVKHYRARCRFAIGEIDGKLHYLLYEHGEPSMIADYFPQACEGICRCIPFTL